MEQLNADPATRDEALWFAIRALVPATLMRLRVYKERASQLFGFEHVWDAYQRKPAWPPVIGRRKFDGEIIGED